MRTRVICFFSAFIFATNFILGTKSKKSVFEDLKICTIKNSCVRKNLFLGGLMVLFRVLVTPSVLLLSVIVILQTIVYSIIQDVKFLMRHLAMIGALCLLLAEHQHRAQKKKEKTASPGLPILDQSRPKDALQLFGRIFLVLLFCTLLHFR